MSRIEEALRRARLSVLDDVVPIAPAPTPEILLRPTALDDAAGDDPIALPDLVHAVDLSEDRVESPEPQLHMQDPAVEQVACADALSDASVHAVAARELLNEKLILNGDLPPAVAEQYRKVAASLHQLQLDRGIKIVMIASAMAADGKTLTASNIALTLSESFRRRVLLIDADLRRPSIHAVFGTPNVTGLNDALNAERDEKLTIFEVTPNLSVLPSGRPNPDPMSSLSSDRMRMILAEAATKFDWVVVDTPPVGVLADAKLLAEMVHAVVLVIAAGQTPFRAIERAIDALDRKRIAGVVLNRVVEQQAAYHYYDYYANSTPRG